MIVTLASGEKYQNNENDMRSRHLDNVFKRTPNGKILDSNRNSQDGVKSGEVKVQTTAELDESQTKSNRPKIVQFSPTQPEMTPGRQSATEFDLLPMEASNDTEAKEKWLRYKLGYVLKIDQTELEERKRDKEVKRMRGRLPQVLTIGVAKCGTTALNFFLQMNPFLCPSRTESNFFVFWDRYRQGYSSYRQHMHQSYPNQITMDMGTYYAPTPGILPRVAAVNKNMKFILVMCDPVARDVSHFVHGQSSNGRNVNGTFENQYFTDTRMLLASRLRYNYDRLIEPWLPFLKEGRLHVVDGNRMKIDPVHELNLVEDFIGVPRVISDKLVVFNKTKGFFCKYEHKQEECMRTSKGREHPDVPTWVTHALTEWYKPQIKRFSEMTGVRFDWMVKSYF